MTDEVQALRAEVAALRAELAESTEGRAARVTRRHLLTGLGVVGAATVAGAAPAGADDLDPMTLGADNTATGTTALQHDAGEDTPAFDVRTTGSIALYASTDPESQPVVGNIKRAIYAAAGAEEGDDVANAVGAFAIDGFALEGVNESDGFPTVAGTNQGEAPGLAAVSMGHGPQLLLFPEDNPTTGPPSWADRGAIRFDGNGDLWLCTTTDPEPAWTRLMREDTAVGRTIPITPVRALDTRAANGRPPGSPAVPGQKKGPLKGGEAITLDLAGVSPIPASASGVVGNLTVVSPSYSGYLMAGPSGTTPTTSALNFTAGAIVANAFTSQLGPDGLTVTASGTASKTYELVVDVTAYIS